MTKVFNFSTVSDGTSIFTTEACPYRQGDNNGIYGLGSWKCHILCKHNVSRNGDTVKCGFRILDLSLTHHWYDEIESGRKTVEYREMSNYWIKRLLLCSKECKAKDCAYCGHVNMAIYDAVRFHRGQGGKQTMMYELLRIAIGVGRDFLGAIPNTNMFKIYLGKRLQ